MKVVCQKLASLAILVCVRGLLNLGADREQKEKPSSIMLDLLKLPEIFNDESAAEDLMVALGEIDAFKTHSKIFREILEEIVIVESCASVICDRFNRMEKEGMLGDTSANLVKKTHEFLDALRSGKTAEARKFLHPDAPKLRDLSRDEKISVMWCTTSEFMWPSCLCGPQPDLLAVACYD